VTAVEDFAEEYRLAFVAQLTGTDQAGLRDGYELGRTAMVQHLSVLDIASIHHEVLFGVLESAEAAVDLRTAAAEGSRFLLEVLSTYEMVQRGVVEAHQTARVEYAHAEQLRKLADASVAINAAGTIEEIAQLLPEHAIRVIGASRATVHAASPRRAAERTFPAQAPAPDPAAPRLHAALFRRNGTSIGQLEVIGQRGSTFTDKDKALLIQLAQLAGVALENVELYEQERLVAETLQRKLLPARLPDLRGITTAWRYLPGWGDSDIGGDWYDALTLPDGRVGLMVGDVMGKGIQAAAGMGQLRIALRAYAIEGHSPAGVLQRLDQVLEGLEEELATAVYLTLDPATGDLCYARAGHPPPLLLSPDGESVLLRGGLAPPLGCMLGVACEEDGLTIQPGSVLVLYTDGLVERRDTNIEHGLEQFQKVASTGDPDDLQGFCDVLLDGMNADDRGDDIALLAVRFDGDAAPG
jgi:hypothetical protein